MVKLKTFGLVSVPGSVLALLASMPSAHAQVADRLTEPNLRREHGIYNTWSYNNTKTKQAKANGSSWAVMGAVAGGYDTNVFDAARNQVGSGLTDTIVRVQHLRYFNDKTRMRVRATVPSRFHAESSRPDVLIGRVEVDLRREQSKSLRYGALGEVKYENNNVTNAEGFAANRVFEHKQVAVSPYVDVRFGDTKVTLAYRGVYRDYAETPGLFALDYQVHGPTAKVVTDLSKQLRISAGYQFRHESYVESQAANFDPAGPSIQGAFSPTNPLEEHIFHKAQVETRWRPTPSLTVSAAYGYIQKTDQFVGFESYDDHMVWTKMDWYALPMVKVGLTGAYQQRQFGGRSVVTGDLLELERVFVSPSARWELSENVAPFVYYTYSNRATNNPRGGFFADRLEQRVFAGIAFAY